MAYPKIRESVKMTPYLNLVISEIQSYLPAGTVVTSAFRTKEDQVRIIVNYARKENFKFSKENIELGDKQEWGKALKHLRSLKDKNGKKKYHIANPGTSKHQTGIALDLIHSIEGVKGLKKIRNAFHKARADKKIKIKTDIIEIKQKCYHVEVETVRLEFEPLEITAK
jgi:hypothetical protein